MTSLALLLSLPMASAPQSGEMAGYLIVPTERVDQAMNGGFSMHVAAWPLLRNYPGQQFQSGLFGTWMFAQFPGEPPKDHYSDIEGGLGWWRDTRFATETPKFIMGGVALNFSEWANGPGAGSTRDWNTPNGLYGVAQLSPWVLWPPDGLNLRQGTRGELFGYGYLPLPLATPRPDRGNQCWTLFLNSANFKGPVAFFTPQFWVKAVEKNPAKKGLFLDILRSDPNIGTQMETQHVPALFASDEKGTQYARVAPTQFPASGSPLIHQMTVYGRAALWNRVESWFNGGLPTTGKVDAKSSDIHRFKGEGYATWVITPPGVPHDKSKPLPWGAFAKTKIPDPTTYSFEWSGLTPQNGIVTLPEHYRLDGDKWEVVTASELPPALAQATFPRAQRVNPEPYVTPTDPKSTWRTPGPVAGPFRVRIGDGSTLTYSWYRFADQPALLNANLTNAEREEMQRRAVLLHRSWTKSKEYLPAPTVGRLAHIDPALIVRPPKGLEAGYVPIVTRQEQTPVATGSRR